MSSDAIFTITINKLEGGDNKLEETLRWEGKVK